MMSTENNSLTLFRRADASNAQSKDTPILSQKESVHQNAARYNLTNIPCDLVLEICSYLTCGLVTDQVYHRADFRSQLALTHICPAWRRILHDCPSFWSYIDIQWPSAVIEHFHTYNCYHPSTLVFWPNTFTPNPPAHLLPPTGTFIDAFQGLRTLLLKTPHIHPVHHASVIDPEFRISAEEFTRFALSKPAPILQKLSICDVRLDADEISGFLLLKELPRLQYLTIRNCLHFHLSLFSAPNLIYLELEAAELQDRRVHIPLTSLDLQTILESFPLLRYLSLGNYDMSSFERQLERTNSRLDQKRMLSAEKLRHLRLEPANGFDRTVRCFLRTVALPSLEAISCIYGPSAPNDRWFDIFSDCQPFSRIPSSPLELTMSFRRMDAGFQLSLQRVSGRSQLANFITLTPDFQSVRRTQNHGYHRALDEAVKAIPQSLAPFSPSFITILVPYKSIRLPTFEAWKRLFESFTNIQQLTVKFHDSTGTISPIVRCLTSSDSCPSLETLIFSKVQLNPQNFVRMLRNRRNAGIAIKDLVLDRTTGLEEPSTLQAITHLVDSLHNVLPGRYQRPSIQNWVWDLGTPAWSRIRL
ncbi:hypothetical protein SISSUDRAFT_1126998 [Sistotremastrum suecicum HHB10207 ss-3]|uniref:F-box domain-containing protein n=1 Tax=Sistotremastrum suecicum HHB10207 ss-3 TaxID=1314776 RepID=A0A166FME5_9AGAM|nr:hypothetical protein SISSUDRAFT_1126998 [Sistotremastrum suecicum HHB10207 ss-3]